MLGNKLFYALVLFILTFNSCRLQYKANKLVLEDIKDTTDKPIRLQEKRIWTFNSLSVTNKFDGAALSEMIELNDSSYIAFIKPENEPINSSPWYAFMLKPKRESTKYITLDYGNDKHRYHPKLLKNGQYTEVDSAAIEFISEHKIKIKLHLDTIATILCAQKLVTSTMSDQWLDSLSQVNDLPYKIYGSSKGGRPLKYLELIKHPGNPFIVLLCRQHPPEVTGWFAFQYFLEELVRNTKLNDDFLEKYNVLIYPVLNPDGVDEGFWRHNQGGVDLNRDWANYNQPEIRQTVDHIVRKSRKNVVLALDFHSTYHDIFYTNNEALKPSRLPDFKDRWLNEMKTEMKEFEFEEKTSMPKTPVSKNWFYKYFNAVGITYEIGDDTPINLIEQKGRLSARKMMEILISQTPSK